jgi:hypothetical protein
MMNRKRYKAVAAILCLSMNLASIAYAGQGAVLCVAHNHVAIEAALSNDCCVESGAPNHADAPTFVSRGGTPTGNRANCGPCMDIPLLSEFLASSAPSSHAPAKSKINATLSSAYVCLTRLLATPLASGSVPTPYPPSKLSGISVLRI